MAHLFRTMRFIEIDAAHRIQDHGSKCRHLHGHRYKIEAHVAGALSEKGQDRGMVLDFSVIKRALIEIVDAYCDHGTILEKSDPLVPALSGNKIYLIERPPTAEVLAAHWWARLDTYLQNEFLLKGGPSFKLEKIRVWETPNCYAEFPAS